MAHLSLDYEPFQKMGSQAIFLASLHADDTMCVVLHDAANAQAILHHLMSLQTTWRLTIYHDTHDCI